MTAAFLFRIENGVSMRSCLLLRRMRLPVLCLDEHPSSWSLQRIRSLSTKDGLSTVQNKKQESGLQRSVLEEVLIKESPVPTTLTEKVAQSASNTILCGAVVAAIGMLGVFVYLLGNEFFAEDSPQKIFSSALALVREDGRCQDIFGPTIAGFGEETSRGRRRHVAHHKYEKDGRQRIRVLFHLKGERDEGIGQAEMELREGDWQWRFLYVESNRRPKITHVLIDNR